MAFKATAEDFRSVANVLRGLSIDGVQKANSGHPGMPMGMADIAAVLWLKYLDHCPARPDWPDRDRFVISNGHGSMLLYSLLHLAGYEMPLAELQSFRQWGSLTPGHPESHLTVGVETTTGPLGQGCGNAVGMALAECMLAERFNTDDFAPVDHYTYVFCGDGDLMEGISHEAFSLAGHLGLNKLIVFYDDNQITIEGSTSLAYSDDVKKRFQGYNWSVITIDAHDYEQVEKAIRRARREKTRPTIIISKSHIGYGSPNKVDTSSAHGEPLGEDEVRATKQNLGLPQDQAFFVSDEVRALFAARQRTLKRRASKWAREFGKYSEVHPEKAKQWNTFYGNIVPDDLASSLPEFPLDTPVATRTAAGRVLQAMAAAMPQLVGGSADLAPSTKTLMADYDSVGPRAFAGRNLHFGVREHAMCGLLNGMALHGGLRVFGATFFVFADYCRPSLRLAALMNLPVIYVFTHDSFYVGEDGPTHQPVEQLASLRCIPGMTVIRPADPTEAGAAWIAALRNTTGPTAMLLTRHNLPVIDRTRCAPAAELEKGAYVLSQTRDGQPDVIIMASGSEVQLALASAEAVAAEHNVRVVSMPSWELFEAQTQEYRDSVLPPVCRARVAIEAAVRQGWDRYTGSEGRVLCMSHFGASAPYTVLSEQFGYTVENVVSMVREVAGGE